MATPEVAEFAKHWANNYNTVTETADQLVKEHQALAVKLATHYLRDLRNLKEGLRISESEVTYVNFDMGNDILEEGTWAVPKSPEQVQELQTLLSNPLAAGFDGEDATSALYNLIGDDELFDRIHELVDLEGEKADVVPTVKKFLQDEMPGLYKKLGLDSDSEMEQPDQAQTPGETPQAGAPATTEPVPSEAPANAAQPGQTAAAIPSTPVAEDADFKRLMKLSGIQSFLVK
jgi:hypothetical protein